MTPQLFCLLQSVVDDVSEFAFFRRRQNVFGSVKQCPNQFCTTNLGLNCAGEVLLSFPTSNLFVAVLPAKFWLENWNIIRHHWIIHPTYMQFFATAGRCLQKDTFPLGVCTEKQRGEEVLSAWHAASTTKAKQAAAAAAAAARFRYT